MIFKSSIILMMIHSPLHTVPSVIAWGIQSMYACWQHQIQQLVETWMLGPSGMDRQATCVIWQPLCEGLWCNKVFCKACWKAWLESEIGKDAEELCWRERCQEWTQVAIKDWLWSFAFNDNPPWLQGRMETILWHLTLCPYTTDFICNKAHNEKLAKGLMKSPSKPHSEMSLNLPLLQPQFYPMAPHTSSLAVQFSQPVTLAYVCPPLSVTSSSLPQEHHSVVSPLHLPEIHHHLWIYLATLGLRSRTVPQVLALGVVSGELGPDAASDGVAVNDLLQAVSTPICTLSRVRLEACRRHVSTADNYQIQKWHIKEEHVQ